jgi:hypothetical protein
MKKSTILKAAGKAAGLLAVLLALGLVFAGCDDDPPCDGDCKKHLDGVISYCSDHDCYVTAYKSGSCNCR